MYLEEKVDKILELLGNPEPQPPSNWTDLLAHAPDLPPQFKVDLLKAMGFQSSRTRHNPACVSLQGSGLICDCVIPEMTWHNPEDVSAHLHDTFEERRERTRALIRKNADPYDADRWESIYPRPNPPEEGELIMERDPR